MQIIDVFIYILASFISVVLGTLIFCVIKNTSQLTKTEKDFQRKKISNKVFKNKRKKYSEIQLYLSKKGVNYIMKRTVDPIEWITVKILCSIVLSIVVFKMFNMFVAIISLFIAYYIPNIIINLSNINDNNKMLIDIKNMYETLKIKTESGIFLTDALFQCFKTANNSRLKNEMLIMINEIKTKNDIMQALSNFENKFDNKYINGFVGVLRQSFDTDDIKSSIDNISKQMNSVQKTIDIQADAVAAKNASLCQIAVLIEIMIVVGYALIRLATTMLDNLF